MSGLKIHSGPSTDPHADRQSPRQRRRPIWRRRLIDAERGFSLSLRRESTLYVHFFLFSIVATAAFVLRVGLIEWAVVILAATVVVTAEMFAMVLGSIRESLNEKWGPEFDGPFRMSTAAVFIALMGSVTSVCLILGRHVYALFAH